MRINNEIVTVEKKILYFVLLTTLLTNNCLSTHDGNQPETESPSLDTDIEPDICLDYHEKCNAWAHAGECNTNSGFMFGKCAKSCNFCDLKATFTDGHEFGVIQRVEGSRILSMVKGLRETKIYMENKSSDCINKHELCSFWASGGECLLNPGYMIKNCAPVCKTCD